MNLSEERNYQKLLSTVELLGLTEKNLRLAEQYLDPAVPEDQELLKGVEHQDLSGLTQVNLGKCREYIEHCKKRNRTEELGRYVRFVAAVGGSTAYYALVTYGWNLNTVLEFLNRQQSAAIRAEGIAWNNYALVKVVSNMSQKDPKVLFEAMDLCYHKSDNAKVLLAALGLYYTRPEKNTGFLTGLFSRSTEDKKVKEVVRYVDQNLEVSIPNLFTGTKPAEGELKLMQTYVREATEATAFPGQVFSILNGKTVSDYLIQLLTSAAILSIEHSSRAVPFIRLAVALKPQLALTTCLEAGGRDWFLAHAEKMEGRLPIQDEDYMLWCLEKGLEGPLRRAIANHPNAVLGAASKFSADNYQSFLKQIDEVNHALYLKVKASCSGEFRVKIAEELTNGYYNTGKQEVRQYLLGETELDTLYPFVKDWREGWNYGTDQYRKIQKLKNDKQEQQMYRRVVVMEGLCMRSRYFIYFWCGTGRYKKMDRAIISQILEVFEEEKLPPAYQIEALAGIHDSFYMEKEKTDFINECAMALRLKRSQWGEDLARLAKEGSAIVRFLCIRVLDGFGDAYKEVLLSCAGDTSKQVRELLTAVYVGHKDWEPEILAMLGSRKSQLRETALLVLKKWGISAYEEELRKALEGEKSKKLKELMESCLGVKSQPAEQAKAQTEEQLVKEILKGGKKRKVSWALETPFPEVHRTDGTAVSEDHMTALLVSYADMNVPGVSKEGTKLAANLNRTELSAYMGLLFNKWLDTGAEARKKWVLYAVSIHGGEAIVPALNAQIQEWPKASRGAMAAEAVKALALNGSPTALLMVDQISRKFKFRQVKAAAGEALSYAAEQLGITRAELEDKIVPNLGFDERMERTFDYGTRKFKVLLTTALELEIYDETGKKLKNLPAPGKKDEPEKAKAASDEFKLLKKQLKTVVTNQKLRLEQALSAERLWPVEQWKELFVKNPVMHQFAIGLIWGCYENGALTDTFRYMEDGSFNTVDEEEYELPSEGLIGLVHPIELTEEDLSAWKEQLSDYEVVQPMEQLERPVYRITKEEKEERELTRFGGKLLNGLSLSGKLQGMGWYRGSVQDAGVYMTFYREDGPVGVELEFSGCYVGDENEEVTVYGAQFYKAGTVARGSYVYDKIKEQNGYRLGEISPRYFSEIVLQLTKATVSSQEQLDYPACKDR